jgi:hypothetical protein
LVLAWQAGREPIAPGPALLEASGEITVKVEGENRLSSDARLRVRSYSGTLETFRVRLPPGMELVESSPVGYRLAVVPPPARAGRAGPVEGQLVDVTFDRPVSGVAEIRVLAIAGPSPPSGAWLPARFDVVAPFGSAERSTLWWKGIGNSTGKRIAASSD